jgi:hypothetical protein
MDAFEIVVGEILRADGYWVQQGVKVELSAQEKRDLENYSMPRPELDLVAYKAATGELLAVECKSYFDSGGLHARDLIDGGRNAKRYKMFVNPALRELVLARLSQQLGANGAITGAPTPRLGLIYGYCTEHNLARLEPWFAKQGWFFHGPDWIAERLKAMATRTYDNQVAGVVAKILLAPPRTARPQAPPPPNPAHEPG